MQNTSALQPMKSIFLPGLALLLSLTPTTIAQENKKPAQPLGDDSEFRTLHSADGAWMAAEERPDRGDGNVRVWSTEDDSLNPIIKGCFGVEAAGVGVVDVVSQLVEAAPTHGNALDLAPGAVLGLAGHAVLLDRVLAG